MSEDRVIVEIIDDGTVVVEAADEVEGPTCLELVGAFDQIGTLKSKKTKPNLYGKPNHNRLASRR